ncbi:DUF4376 domain-containing protein [Burkholderia gladioli]|uniref:DUF4376 domain-containing protein n=1 Tax=Burkholderia gladioli TaxID=28095 RepID=UPI001C5D0878|nr:DUF4376 domain-containing protein [Burkholderia gladioli]MBW5285787.1 DUF4376 domain-containing protein [Burkholderia gladioli]
MPTVYHFDDATGVYTGSGLALRGPAGDIQVPAFSTLVAPLVCQDGYIAQAAVGATGAVLWAAVRDLRAVPVYRVLDGSVVRLGEEIAEGAVWTGLGELPPTLTTLPRPTEVCVWQNGAWVVDLAQAKAAKVATINAERDRCQGTPFSFNGKKFGVDVASISRITSAASLAALARAAGSTYSVDLPAVDGADVTLDADGVIALASALTAAVSAVFDTARKLKAEIDAASSVAELDAIAWPAAA